MKRHVAILGSTGSIGTQALQVIESHPDVFELEVLTAGNNVDLLVEQALRFVPNHVVIANEAHYTEVSDALSSLPTKVYAGEASIAQVVEMESIDIVLTAMVGFAGLYPTIAAIKAGKNIALANKETLVVAGELITRLAAENKVNIYPVDSEHSAIFQCLAGEDSNQIEKIYLTASGGPFRTKTYEELKNVTRAQALQHPNWCMGDKVTIDSATLMNKGLETIEARWLFNLDPSKIEVVVHPQSIIHSIVQFQDGSMKAQMGLPDMRLPIQYALGYPRRLSSDFPRFNFLDYPELTFMSPDTEKFKCLNLAYEAMKKGGNVPCIMNAANEIAVDAFLKEAIDFLDIPGIIRSSVEHIPYISKPEYPDYIQSDQETRKYAKSLLSGIIAL